MHRRPQEFVSRLTGAGLRFRSFTLAQEGDCAVSDGIRNYKDVPHLSVVHQPAISHSTYVSDGTLADWFVTISPQGDR